MLSGARKNYASACIVAGIQVVFEVRAKHSSQGKCKKQAGIHTWKLRILRAITRTQVTTSTLEKTDKQTLPLHQNVQNTHKITLS